MKKIKITVEGSQGVGKSVMAKAIGGMLVDEYDEVKIYEEDQMVMHLKAPGDYARRKVRVEIHVVGDAT